MKKTLFFSILILSLTGNSQPVFFNWAKQMEGTIYGSGTGTSIITDAAGNVYATGYFTNTVDFDPGVGVSNLTSKGGNDVFIQKLDTYGNFLWVKQMGDVEGDFGNSITVDASGNVYTTGSFGSTVDFDPGVGVSNLTSKGGNDVFILKLDANGNFEWVKQMGDVKGDFGNSITLDASGNLYTIGTFMDTVDFDPGPGVSYLIANGNWDVFIQKLDKNGNLLWVKQTGGNGKEIGNSINLDAASNVYTTGVFKWTVDFDPGTGVSNLSANGWDTYIQKLDSNGNFLWAKQIDVSSSLYGSTDDLGNLYTTGFFYGTVDFDPGAGVHNLTANGIDVFIQKLDANGNLLWVKQIGGTNWDEGCAITVDASSSVYTTGLFHGTVDFDPGPGVSNLSTNAGATFIQKLDSNGNFQWVKQVEIITEPRSEWNNGDLTEITVDAFGSVYTTGWFCYIVDFDPGPGVSNLTTNGSCDIFILKLGIYGIGILENDFGTEFLLYPNPTNGFFTIDLGKPYDASITITDVTGKTILSKSVENSQLVNLKLEEPAGVYLLIVESAEKKAVIKLVKE